MKYQPSIYAKALAEVILGAKPADSDRIVKNFLAMMERNGDAAHMGKVLEEAARFARGKRGIRKVTLEFARTPSALQRKAVGALIRESDMVVETVDPELIAGVRIVVDEERQLDGSLKGKLDKLFGN